MFNLRIHDVEARPSVFHVSQHKCGSQWIAEILKYCAYRRVVMPEFNEEHFSHPDVRLVQGLIYPTLYLTKDEFNQVLSKNPHIKQHKTFVVIRDLRDILISLYFSVKNSHQSGYEAVDEHRKVLSKLSTEDGMLFLMETQMKDQARLQSSWLDSKVRIFRFEELVEDDEKMITEVLNYCEIDVDQTQFDLVMENNSFKRLSGRTRGQEDQAHHYRKGVSGDWKNYFSPKLKTEFKIRFGDIISAAGYEKNNSW